MKLEEYKSGKYVKMNDYKAFIPSKINYNWGWDDTKLDKLLAMHDTFRNENETLLSRYCWSNFDYKNSKMCTGYRKKWIH